MRRLNIQTHKELASLAFTARPVTYTRHAKERALAKGVTLSKSVYISAGDVVELEIVGNRASKIVVRQSMGADKDRVMVLVPNGDGWTCVTVWTNHKNDNHATLNKTRISA
jgi:hypothetical protein